MVNMYDFKWWKLKIYGNDTRMIAAILLKMTTWAHMAPMKMIIMVIMTLMTVVEMTMNDENVWL